MWHSGKNRSANETYGDISEEELLEAIDSMRFDNGSTRVLGRRYEVAGGVKDGHGLEKV